MGHPAGVRCCAAAATCCSADKDSQPEAQYVAVENNKGIYEYLLSSKNDPKLLSIRVFDDRTKVVVYEQQTQKAEAAGVSNCPLCAIGHDANKTRTYALTEMGACRLQA